MAHYLGIDGGGSGCRAVLADAQGHVLGRGTGGPANINTDVETAADSIRAATAEAVATLPIAPRDMIAVLGLAGGTMQGAVTRLTGLLPFARVQIVNDAITAARGALGPNDGVLAAMGTGSVFAVQRAGQVRQVGGRGFLLGDQGSGAVLGRKLLAQALVAADDLGPMTPLLARVLADHGGIEGIIGFANRARPHDFARLAPLLLTEDPAAEAILGAATAKVAQIVTTLRGDEALPVVFAGGLGPIYAARLAHLFPITAPAGTALDGALAMAFELGQATGRPMAGTHLRAGPGGI